VRELVVRAGVNVELVPSSALEWMDKVIWKEA
jgi:hypothetical protein